LMRLSGSFEVASPPERVWRLVTDPRQISKAIPDLKRLDVRSESEFDAEFKLRVGFLSGTMRMRFNYEELGEPSKVVLRGRGSGMQSTVDLRIVLEIEGRAGGVSEVKWLSDVILGGAAAGLGARIIEDVARSKISHLVENLRRIVSEVRSI